MACIVTSITDTQQTLRSRELAHVETIRRIGGRLLRERQELDDFTQDVILRVYANRDQLRDETLFPQWVSAIARNTARNRNRKARPALGVVLPDVVDETPSVLDRMEQSERWQALLDALNALDPVDRALLYARYVDEASYAELEERHDLSYAALTSRVHRTRRHLQRRLAALFGAIAAFLGVKGRSALGGVLVMQLKNTAAVVAIAGFSVLLLSGGGVAVYRYYSHVSEQQRREHAVTSSSQAAETRNAPTVVPATTEAIHTNTIRGKSAENGDRKTTSANSTGTRIRDDELESAILQSKIVSQSKTAKESESVQSLSPELQRKVELYGQLALLIPVERALTQWMIAESDAGRLPNGDENRTPEQLALLRRNSETWDEILRLSEPYIGPPAIERDGRGVIQRVNMSQVYIQMEVYLGKKLPRERIEHLDYFAAPDYAGDQ